MAMNAETNIRSLWVRRPAWILAGILWVLATGITVQAQDQMPKTNNTLGPLGTTSTDPCEDLFTRNPARISLDFQNSNIKDIFRVIADVSRLNIVLSAEVRGTANVLLMDVPWPQALQTILDSNQLGRACEDDIVRVAPKLSLRRAELEAQLLTEMVKLNYSDLGEMADNLGILKSLRGKVSQDERTNTLILTDTRNTLDDMIQVVRRLDIPTPQVQIESKIVQINRNFVQELGVQWGFQSVTFRNPQFPNSIVVTGAARGEGPLRNGTAGFTQDIVGVGDARQGFIVDLGVAQPPSFAVGASLISRDGDLALDLQLSALERQGKTRIIANPKVVTADNKEAKIRQGERIPFLSQSGNEGTKVEFVDGNLELKVVPHITADQNVYLKVEARQNSFDFNTASGIPRLDTREAITEVLVEDGGTTIIGGLHQRTLVENRRAVPYLADIPILGLLFKSTLEQDTVDELLIFITPTIIRESTQAGS